MATAASSPVCSPPIPICTRTRSTPARAMLRLLERRAVTQSQDASARLRTHHNQRAHLLAPAQLRPRRHPLLPRLPHADRSSTLFARASLPNLSRARSGSSPSSASPPARCTGHRASWSGCSISRSACSPVCAHANCPTTPPLLPPPASRAPRSISRSAGCSPANCGSFGSTLLPCCPRNTLGPRFRPIHCPTLSRRAHPCPSLTPASIIASRAPRQRRRPATNNRSE